MNLTWTGSASSNWFDNDNWSPAQVPGGSDTATINSGLATEGATTADVGRLMVGSSGSLELSDGTAFSILQGGSVIAGSVVIDGDFCKLEFSGSLHVSGTIAISPNQFGDSDLAITGNAVLDGGGSIVLPNNDLDAIIAIPPPPAYSGAPSPGLTLVNDDIISGAGTLGNGDGSLVLINGPDGVIDANSSYVLEIDSKAETLNYGTIEATGGGAIGAENIENLGSGRIVVVPNNPGGPITTAFLQDIQGGTITIGIGTVAYGYDTISDARIDIVSNSSGAGELTIFLGFVTLVNDAVDGGGVLANVMLEQTTVFGGTLEGTVNAAYPSESDLNGSTIASGSAVEVDYEATLELTGTITNNGTIRTVGSIYAPADIAVSGLVKLAGAGAFTLGLDGSSSVLSAGRSGVLENVGNTISGSGTFGDGDGSLSVTNDQGGTILCSSGSLVFDLDQGSATAGRLTNAGLIEATGGVIDCQGALVNSGLIDADGGTIVSNSPTNVGGRIEIGNGGEFSLADGTSSAAVQFTSNNGVLQLGNSGDFTGTVAGLKTGNAQGDAIDLVGVNFATISKASVSPSGVLTIASAAGSNSITLLGQYVNAFTEGTPAAGYTGFVLNEDTTGHGGTLVTYVANAPAPAAAA
jgi:hypothetical protein